MITHDPPVSVPGAEPPYTVVTEGVAGAIAKTSAEFVVDLVPVVLGGGVRLFEGLDPADHELMQVVDAPGVLHLRYRCRSRG